MSTFIIATLAFEIASWQKALPWPACPAPACPALAAAWAARAGSQRQLRIVFCSHPYMDISDLLPTDGRYPRTLLRGFSQPVQLAARGNLELVSEKKIALFCSERCPARLTLQAGDLARQLGESELTVVSGFQTPVEHECLALLLLGHNPLILCPARTLRMMRIPPELKKALKKNRLLLLSPFPIRCTRVTGETSLIRDRFVANLADALFVIHAMPGSRMEALCREAIVQGKPLYTIECEQNGNLIRMGAKGLQSLLGRE